MAELWFLSPYEGRYSHTNRNHLYASYLSEYANCIIISNSTPHNQFKKSAVSKLVPFSFWEIPSLPYRGNGLIRALGMFTYSIGVLFLFFLNEKKPDYLIVDSVHPLSGVVAALIKRINPKIYFAFQIRDIWPYALVCDGSIKQASFIRKFFTACEFASLKSADCVISSLPGYSDYLSSHWPVFSNLPIFYQPNPIVFDVNLKHHFSKHSSSERPVPLKFVYAGGFSNAHGVPQMMKYITSLLRLEDLDVEFHFYGVGVTLAESMSIARGNSRIYFYQPAEKSEVASLISQYHICMASLLPSEIYNYGLNLNKLYDYMKASMPILLLCGSYKNCVQDSSCGLVASPGSYDSFSESICTFASMSHSQLQSMGQRGYQYALTTYDITKLGPTYSEALRLSPKV